MNSPSRDTSPRLDRGVATGWIMIGFALGGFFDGILLHQILQWHHLLSGIDDPAGSDLHFQVTMDGLFHLLMYVVAVAGTIVIVARRAKSVHPATSSTILRLTLFGFGVWHVVDAVVSHWLLGIHRIRMDSDVPLLWDIAWLVIFGIVPILIALLLPTSAGPRRGAAAAAMTLTLAAGIAAGAGPRFAEGGETIVVFRKDVDQARMMAGVAHAGATVRWTDASGTIWSLDTVSWRGLAALYANGALVVGTTPVIAGCLAWTRPA